MLASLLCDGVAFTRSLEAAYRRMWQRWRERRR
jgi:predicted O-linked N-acetylglucosamine transferase (SPINDLY family)